MRAAAYHFSNGLRYRDEDHPSNTQFTPAYVLDPVRLALGGTIGLDPCTTADNPVGAERFYCPPVNGAAQPWDAASCYVNPPYSKARERWVLRCIEAGAAGAAVVLLIPAATDTRIFQLAMLTASAVVFIRGRLKFGTLRPNRRQVAASHPSSLIGWNTDLAACQALGLTVSLNHKGGVMNPTHLTQAELDQLAAMGLIEIVEPRANGHYPDNERVWLTKRGADVFYPLVDHSRELDRFVPFQVGDGREVVLQLKRGKDGKLYNTDGEQICSPLDDEVTVRDAAADLEETVDILFGETASWPA